MSPHPGYAFIPLPDHVDRRARPQACHDRRAENTHSGTLSLTWVAEQPIHIGSGFKVLSSGKGSPTIVRQLVRVGDIPCIPGSTLKGVIRARYEAITRSCATGPKLTERGQAKKHKIRSTTYGKLGVKEAILVLTAADGDVLTQCKGDHLCPACALFGLLNLRSRLVITDALPDALTVGAAEIPAQFAPNLHHIGRPSLDRDASILKINTLHGRKFAVRRDLRPPPSGYASSDRPAQKQTLEVIPKTSRLYSEIRFFNLTPAELGGVLAALGYDPKSRLKVGGGKGHELGRLHLDGLALTPHPRKAAKPDLDQCRKDFEADPGAHVVNLNRLVALHGEDC